MNPKFKYQIDGTYLDPRITDWNKRLATKGYNVRVLDLRYRILDTNGNLIKSFDTPSGVDAYIACIIDEG
jgi:hypothetical protein